MAEINDYTSLRSWEESNDAADSSTTSIVEDEAEASYETVGFDSDNTSPSSPRRRQRAVKFRGKVGRNGLVAIASFSFVLFLLNLISGPMQAIQAAELIKDYVIDVTRWQQTARNFSTSGRFLSKIGNSSIKNTLSETKLGKLALHKTTSQVERLSENGVSFDEGSLGISKGITIDTEKALGTAANSSTVDDFASSVGISSDKISIIDNKLHIDSSDLSYSNAKKIIYKLDDATNSKVASWMQTRSTLKSEGYVKWTHLIEKSKMKLLSKTQDFIDSLTKPVMEGVNTSSSGADGVKENNNDDNTSAGEANGEEAKKIAETNDTANKNIDRAIEESGIEEETTRSVTKSDSASSFMSKHGAQIGLLVLMVACLIENAQNNVGPYKMTNVVSPAMKISSQVMGLASQVQSGEDISLQQLRGTSKYLLGDNVDVKNDDGKKVGTEYNSFFDGYVTCTVARGNGCAKDDGTPASLKDVSNGSFNFMSNGVGNFFSNLFSSDNPFGFTLKHICKVFNLAQYLDLKGQLFGWIASKVLALVDNSTHAVSSLFSWVNNMFYGKPFNAKTLTPAQIGDSSMYGGKFIANSQSLSTGGRELTSSENLSLNLENRRFLAWQNSQKPVMARVFDPADYNSSINQIARSINAHSVTDNQLEHLADAFKVMTSAPQVIALANNQIAGGTAYAAADFDYGVPTYSWSLDEMNDLTKTTNSVANNTLKAKRLLDSANGSNYRSYADKCLSVTIGDKSDGYAVAVKDNKDGTSWNYVDAANHSSSGDCSVSKGQSTDYQTIRLYVMDYYNTVSGSCYDGKEDDATSSESCNEMSVDTDISDSTELTASKADTIEEKFNKDTKNSGDYDKQFGRQDVDLTEWFVDKYTNLVKATGNSSSFMANLLKNNPTIISSNKASAPAIFWTANSSMGATSAGKVGIVTKVTKKSITTLENSSSENKLVTKTYSSSDYKGTKFVNLTNYVNDRYQEATNE